MSKEMGKSWVGLETLHIISLFLTQNYFLYQSMPLEISFVIFLQLIGSTDFKIQEEINLMKNSLQRSFE